MIMAIKILISFFWFISFTKALFFWVWLWQLKEYHFGRFRAHFQTFQGKKLVFNLLNGAKLGLIVFPIFLRFFLFSPRFDVFFLYLLSILFLFVLEGLKSFLDFQRKTLKFPVLTKKTALILGSGFLFEIFVLSAVFFPAFQRLFPSLDFSHNFYYLLLVLDFFAPLIVSFLVFLWHSFSFFWRLQVLKRAQRKREKFKKLLVIGITGSYGKTSTKEFLAEILSKKFKVLKTKKHINAEIGIAQTILQELKEDHEVFVCEIGAYERGKIKEVCNIIKPKIGILTGINEQHLATFGSQENIIKGKFELIESLPEDGIAIFNGDNEIITSNLKTQISNLHLKSKIFCSTKEKLDLWAEDIKVEKESISFKIFSKDGDWAKFKVNLLGSHNIVNILMAAACAKELGMSLGEIAEICRKLKPLPGALKLLKSKKGFLLLDATYSANPHGVVSHLDYLKIWEGKKVIVMPSLIELGKAAKEVHRRIGEKIGESCDLAIITTRDYFKELKAGVQKSGASKYKILLIEKPERILEKIKNFSQPGDVILLESRVPQKLINSLINSSANI